MIEEWLAIVSVFKCSRSLHLANVQNVRYAINTIKPYKTLQINNIYYIIIVPLDISQF